MKKFIEMLLDGNNPLSPKLLLLMWISFPLLLAGITSYFEKKEKKYKYYKNDIYTQWRKFK